MVLIKTGWVVSNFDKDISGQTLTFFLQGSLQGYTNHLVLLHLPQTVGFILASSGKQSDPKMSQLYLLCRKILKWHEEHYWVNFRVCFYREIHNTCLTWSWFVRKVKNQSAGSANCYFSFLYSFSHYLTAKTSCGISSPGLSCSL